MRGVFIIIIIIIIIILELMMMRKVRSDTTLKAQAIAAVRQYVWPEHFEKLPLPQSVIRDLGWIGGAPVMGKRFLLQIWFR